MVGSVSVPSDFQYRDVLAKGYPGHLWNDCFRLKHPSMNNSNRAKIFSPFDALKGFDEAVAEKEILYENRRELDEEEIQELGRRLIILHNLTINRRKARENCVSASVTFYVPCEDKNNAAFGYRGQYKMVTGIVWKVTADSILISEKYINIHDIVAIESQYEVIDPHTQELRTIFEEAWCD